MGLGEWCDLGVWVEGPMGVLDRLRGPLGVTYLW